MRVNHVALKVTVQKYFYEDFLKTLRSGGFNFRNIRITDRIKNIIYNRIVYSKGIDEIEDHPEITLDRIWGDNSKWRTEGPLLISKLCPCDSQGYIVLEKQEDYFYRGMKDYHLCRWIIERDI